MGSGKAAKEDAGGEKAEDSPTGVSISRLAERQLYWTGAWQCE
jgi:hypothetical protein